MENARFLPSVTGRIHASEPHGAGRSRGAAGTPGVLSGPPRTLPLREARAAALRRPVSTLPLNRTFLQKITNKTTSCPPQTLYFWKPKPPSENKPLMAVLPGTRSEEGGRGLAGPGAGPPVSGPKARGSPFPLGSERVF